MAKNRFFALYGFWEGLVWCEILPQGVGTICPYFWEVIFCAKIEKCKLFVFGPIFDFFLESGNPRNVIFIDFHRFSSIFLDFLRFSYYRIGPSHFCCTWAPLWEIMELLTSFSKSECHFGSSRHVKCVLQATRLAQQELMSTTVCQSTWWAGGWLWKLGAALGCVADTLDGSWLASWWAYWWWLVLAGRLAGHREPQEPRHQGRGKVNSLFWGPRTTTL